MSWKALHMIMRPFEKFSIMFVNDKFNEPKVEIKIVVVSSTLWSLLINTTEVVELYCSFLI